MNLTTIGTWFAEIFDNDSSIVFQYPSSFVDRYHGQILLPVGIISIDVYGVVTKLAK